MPRTTKFAIKKENLLTQFIKSYQKINKFMTRSCDLVFLFLHKGPDVAKLKGNLVGLNSVLGT